MKPVKTADFSRIDELQNSCHLSTDLELWDSDVHVLRHRDHAERQSDGGEARAAAPRQELRAGGHRRPLLRAESGCQATYVHIRAGLLFMLTSQYQL